MEAAGSQGRVPLPDNVQRAEGGARCLVVVRMVRLAGKLMIEFRVILQAY